MKEYAEFLKIERERDHGTRETEAVTEEEELMAFVSFFPIRV